jgi:hypothetical protein
MKIILLALFAGVIAAAPQNTLKTRLGQKGAKNLAQSQIVNLNAGENFGADSASCATEMSGNLGS